MLVFFLLHPSLTFFYKRNNRYSTVISSRTNKPRNQKCKTLKALHIVINEANCQSSSDFPPVNVWKWRTFSRLSPSLSLSLSLPAMAKWQKAKENRRSSPCLARAFDVSHSRESQPFSPLQMRNVNVDFIINNVWYCYFCCSVNRDWERASCITCYIINPRSSCCWLDAVLFAQQSLRRRKCGIS